MPSIAQHHFPMVRWRNGERCLWNPIHRNVLKNRPEERVRLRIIEFLLDAGWSRHRITTEEAVKGHTDTSLRTDIICYNQEFDPKILVECKAENVPVSGKTAEQIARYNRNVQASYLLLSNGLQDYWYRIDTAARTVRSLPDIPDLLPIPENSPNRTFGYWKIRGFAGEKAEPALRRWLEQALPSVALADSQYRYLQFKKSPSGIDLNHYYAVINKGGYKLAFSFMDTPYGGSRIIGILNRKGENHAVVEIDLDLVFKNDQPNASVYSGRGVYNIDIREESGGFFEEINSNTLDVLSGVLERVFEENV